MGPESFGRKPFGRQTFCRHTILIEPRTKRKSGERGKYYLRICSGQDLLSIDTNLSLFIAQMDQQICFGLEDASIS